MAIRTLRLHNAARHVVAAVTSVLRLRTGLRLAPSFTIVLFITLFLLLHHSSIQPSNAEYINDVNNNNDRGLFPPTFNLASSANITSNATCGENGEETFCKLVEHVRAPQCGICDAKSPNISQRHPISNAIDGTNHWWQSPSLQNGRQYEWVTITLDLQQVYQVAYVIVKAANSPRPGNWVLERSLDGVTFLPWQYYAITESECIEAYGILPTIGIPRYRSDEEVICTAYYSRLEPLENGEIHTSLVKGRPGVDGPTDRLQEFTAARFVRLRLQKLRSLHADLMSVATREWEKVHKTVTRRLFYSIKDISIGGQCMCFGHAQDCRSDPHTKRLKCHCVHNACGDSCEKCCPLYNQKPWRLGTSTDAGLCEKCQCFGHADECRYDKEVAIRRDSLNIEGKYEGGGVCIGCRDFTTGINCEQCVDGYYNPPGVPFDAAQPCVPCNCSGLGTVGHCVKNSSLLVIGKKAGDCICRLGFAGAQCDRCDIGYRNYPICDICPCNFAGTINTECEGECICKPNVDGVRCDRCKPGHFNLDVSNPKGCRKCYCSGATNRCVSADLGIQVVTSRDGWLVSDALGKKIVRPIAEGNAWTVASDDMTGYDTYFWVAPQQFTGNQLNSYGGEIRYNLSWVKARGDSAGWLTTGPSIILEGGDGTMIAYWSDGPHKSSEVVAEVILTESGWVHFSPEHVTHLRKIKRKELRSISRKNFMEVLVSLKRLLIQAKFHTDQIVGKLNSVSFEFGSEDAVTVRRLKDVERCHCPIGYAGLSCESCEKGYRKVNNTLFGGKCEKCDCNGHVDSCDPFTGACHECLHHTTGDKCQLCEVGYYGVATTGSPEDCKKCACPLEDPKNQWSKSCSTVLVNASRVDYTCDECAVGYKGAKCESCDKGYFGNPLVPGNYCQPCHCYGENGDCDILTGRCIACAGNRDGWHCELCQVGFWGDPFVAPCQACKCDPFGSLDSTKCDQKTGSCECRPLYIGQRCDRCIDNYGNVEAGCHSCDCNEMGSVSPTCDSVSGQCQCKTGVFGTKCDACLDGYYDFSETGCKWCNCSTAGSLSPTCSSVSGQCSCAAHVTGRQCQSCEDGYWNLISAQGCTQCQCNPVGSIDFTCDQISGQCRCRDGVGGSDCSKCLPGYFGFSNNGCRKCDECDKAGHLCHPLSGECVCPPLTTGPTCGECKRNSWGFDSLLGCQPCNCSRDGSQGSQCNVETGECSCLEGYEGRLCNRCRFGYFDFLKCKRCKCHLDGTDPTKCRLDGHCECSEDGQCPCKANVEGKKCRRCRTGSFGRIPIQAEGCTPCFCFGKSNRCRQADFIWTRLRLPRGRLFSVVLNVNQSGYSNKNRTEWITTSAETCYINLAHLDSRKTTVNGDLTPSVDIIHGLRVIPGTAEDIEIANPAHINAPIYWKLPDTFQGDLVSSYNGRLVFRVGSEGGQLFPTSVLDTYPLVLLQGNYRLVLEYYPEINSPNEWYDIHLHESQWKFKNNPDIPVDRPTMMVALQRVQHILVRATDRTDFNSAWISNVSIDVLTMPPKPFSPDIAVGIEICQCPPQYNGTSCQDPANGYYRFRKNDTLDSKDILDLVGIALPCSCNGRSKECDKETGICKNCQFNTSGNQCEKCADGFYGDPSVGVCQPCACPFVNNSFSDRCTVIGNTLTCTHCREGHYGNLCEKCMHGYYGDPLSPGGKCLPCDCDVRGSLGNVCDQTTGQCICLEGLTGRDCSVCPYRHVLTDYGCQSCQDECTGLLLDDLEDISITLSLTNMTGVNPAPWGNLLNYENRLESLKRQVDFYKQSLIDGQTLINDYASAFNLEERIDKQSLKVLDLNRNSSGTCNEAIATRLKAEEFLKYAVEIQQLIAETVRRLKEYSTGVNKVSVQLFEAVAEAELKLNQILAITFGSYDEDANKELRRAKSLLEQLRLLIFDPLRTENLSKRLKELGEVLNEAQNLIPKNINVIRMQYEDNHSRFNRSKEMVMRAEEVKNDIYAILNHSSDLIRQAHLLILQAKNNSKRFSEVLMELEGQKLSLETHVAFFARKLPNATELVKMAIQHADKLTKMANRLDRLFNSTRNESLMAMKASNAYADVARLLESARDVAIMAQNLAMDTLMSVKPINSPTLSDDVSMALAHSEILKMDASNLMDNKLNGLEKKWDQVEDILDITDMTNDKNKLQYLNVKSELDNIKFKDGLKKTTEGINRKSNQAKRLTDDVNRQLKPILSKLDERKEQAKKLALASNNTIWNLTSEINKTMKDIFQLSGSTDTKSRKNFDNKLMALKNGINVIDQDIITFRQASGNWLLGLYGDGLCKRELWHEIKDNSFSNSFSFHYDITTNHSNSLIFYIGSPVTKEYLAVEMVNRTMRFVWDAGGGPTILSYPDVRIDTFNDDYARFYHIEVNRTGNQGFMRIKNLKNDTWFETKSAKSKSDFNVISFGKSATFLIGDRPNGIQITSDNFYGCISNFKINNQNIGLWNFKSNAAKGECQACKAESINARELGFRGNGHLQFKGIRPRRSKDSEFYIIFYFQTYNENSLLFFASDQNEDGFFAVYLSGGKVFLKIRFSNSSEILELNTSEKYNNNHRIRVQASQMLSRGALLVADSESRNDEKKDVMGTDNTKKLILFNRPLFFGGIPHAINLTSWLNTGVSFAGLYGCMREIQILGNILDLQSKDLKLFGVALECPSLPSNRIIVEENGFLELKGHPLAVGSSIGFSIQSTESTSSPNQKANAMLLLSTFIDSTKPLLRDDFYSLVLKDGILVFNSNGRKTQNESTRRIKVNETQHIIIKRSKSNLLDVRVNDELVQSVALTNNRTIESERLFLGGVDPSIRNAAIQNNQISVSRSFRGVISDITFNDNPAQLNEYKNLLNVTQGEKFFQSRSSIPQINHKKQVKRCASKAQIGQESRALKFGDSNNSYVSLDLNKSKINQSKHSMMFDFRTHYPDGLLIIVSGDKRKRAKHLGKTAEPFIIVHLNKGRIVVEDTSTSSNNSFQGLFHDGRWHKVRIQKMKKVMEVEVDSKKKSFNSGFTKPRTVGFGNILNSVKNRLSRIHKKIDMPSFKGCIRNFQVNNVVQDLSGTPNINSVRTCYSNVEAGSWFEGDAYAIYDSKFAFERAIEIELQFRTTEMSGVLISVSDKTSGLQLGLINGNVTMKVVLTNGDELEHSIGFGEQKFYLCDYRWHNVTATYTVDGYMSIRVDDEYEQTKRIDVKRNDLGNLGAGPLYIGGLPDTFSNHGISQVSSRFIRDNFKGCIRNVIIQGRIKDWIDMLSLHNVLINSCYQQQNSTP